MTDPARMSDAELRDELLRFGHGSLANDERGSVVLEAARRLKPAPANEDAAREIVEKFCAQDTDEYEWGELRALIAAALAAKGRAAEERITRLRETLTYADNQLREYGQNDPKIRKTLEDDR